MVASLTPTSPSHAVSVPTSRENGRPDEKPNASIVADFRVASAARNNLHPFGRAFAAVANIASRLREGPA